MKPTLILPMISLVLILNACAPVLPAQSIAENPLPGSTAALKIMEQPDAQSTVPEVKTATLENSLLVAGWNSRQREYQLYPIQPQGGEALPGYTPISIGPHFYHAIASDRSKLAFIVFRSSERPVGGSLLLVNLGQWNAQIAPLELDGWVSGLSFSLDGRRLALTLSSRENLVVIIDLEKQAIIAQQGLDFLPSRLKYTQNGSKVFVYGTPIKDRYTVNEAAAGPPQVVLLDGENLSVSWSAELAGVRDGVYPKESSKGENGDLHQPGMAVYDLPGVVFAPDRDALYLVHSALDKLTTVDYAAQQVSTVDIHPVLSWFERLLWLTAGVAKAKVAEGASLRAQVSPDGELLYVVGAKQELVEDKSNETMYESTPLGLQVIRIADGVILDQLESLAVDLAISPKGDRLYLHTWKERGSETEVVQTGDLEVVARLDGNLAPLLRMNGEALLASTEWINSVKSRMLIVDPESLSVLADWSGSEHAIFIATP